MAHIIINALSLRPGGGLQVVCGLLARFRENHRYTVLWSDQQSKLVMDRIVGQRGNVEFVKPLQASSNVAVFAWQMLNLNSFCAAKKGDLVFSVNHHFPAGGIPQLVYHLNVFRFTRPHKAIWRTGELADRLRDWRAKKALLNASANVFESQFLLEEAQLVKAIINRPEVIYIGLEDVDGVAVKLMAKGQVQPHIIAITSPQPHKDNPTLLHMLVELVGKRPEVDWRLKIAGGRTPQAFSNLVELTKSLGIGDRIDWLGFKNHGELAEISRDCLCMVSTSKVESFCMVALEAMSWGCAVVVADSTAMPESVGSAALLAEPGNATDFASKVLLFHDDSNLRADYIARGEKHAAKLSWTSAANQFEAIFVSLVRNASEPD